MLDTENNRVDLGDILGESYRNIFLQYKYHRGTGELESVFPFVKSL